MKSKELIELENNGLRAARNFVIASNQPMELYPITDEVIRAATIYDFALVSLVKASDAIARKKGRFLKDFEQLIWVPEAKNLVKRCSPGLEKVRVFGDNNMDGQLELFQRAFPANESQTS